MEHGGVGAAGSRCWRAASRYTCLDGDGHADIYSGGGVARSVASSVIDGIVLVIVIVIDVDAG